MAYEIKTEGFQGSVELLLDLVKKSEVDVYQVWISEITKKYLEYLVQVEKMDLNEALEFLIIAATLVFLKSRSLLPTESLVSEIEDEQEKMSSEQQIQEYERYKNIAAQLKGKAEYAGQLYTRPIPEELKKEEYVEATLFDLVNAFKGVLDAASKKKDDVRNIEKEVVTIEQRIAEITKMLEVEKKVKFSAIFRDAPTRLVIVVTFLALLELVRMGKVFAVQSKLFEEIELVKAEGS